MKHILVVDDNKANLAAARQELCGEYQVTPVISGMQALKFLERKRPDLILLDINMPQMDGKETLRRIKEDSGCCNIPVIFLTADGSAETEAECLALGGDDFIAKPFIPNVMRSRISRLLELYELRFSLEKQLEIKSKQADSYALQSFSAIACTVDERERSASGHSAGTAFCADEIARRMGLGAEFRRSLHFAAMLHDIGKISIPESILNKPGKLTEEEFDLVKRHTSVGNELLKEVRMIENISDGVLYHHEHFDGSGYPGGLAGNQIPLSARIICAADAYDAMSSDRIYRPRLSAEEIDCELKKGSGTQFDPEIAEILLSMNEEGFALNRNGDDGESGFLLRRVLSEYASDISSRADTDPLTGLLNRGAAEAKIDELIIKHGGAFMMLDLDNFKRINDTKGHLAGDLALKTAANALSECACGEDTAARLGGDEFVFFLAGERSDEDITAAAEKIFGRIADAPECSVSIGIAVAGRDGNSFRDLYSCADKALYFVKKNGKSAYSFYSKPDGSEAEDVSTEADLDAISDILGNGRSTGIMQVRYDDFKQIYSFLTRCVSRNDDVVQTVLFTVHGENTDYPDAEKTELALEALEQAAAFALRAVDVGTRYSSCQYIVLLNGADAENGKRVAERVIKIFSDSCDVEGVKIVYGIRTMQKCNNLDMK